MSYQDFLLNVAKVHPDAVWFYQTRSTGLFLMNIDALPAYTYNYNTLYDLVPWALSTPDDRAHVVGRATFGRIAIANADAAGSSHTDAAIDMAYRAVNEILASRSSEYASRLKSAG